MRRVLLGVMLVAGCDLPKAQPPPNGDGDDDARIVLESWLIAPATAQYRSTRTIYRAADKRIVHVVLDAQNAFGALIRQSLCVAFTVTDTRVKWTKAIAVSQCSNPPLDAEITLLRSSNWPDEIPDWLKRKK